MSHVQGWIADIELGVLALVALARWLHVSVTRRRSTTFTAGVDVDSHPDRPEP